MMAGLQEKVVDFYAKYAQIAFDRYGDRVKTGLHSTNQSFPKRVAIWMLFAGRMNKTQKVDDVELS